MIDRYGQHSVSERLIKRDRAAAQDVRQRATRAAGNLAPRALSGRLVLGGQPLSLFLM
jgi:hypothetical protein